MLSALYTDQMLAAAASLPPSRRLSEPDASATKVSRVCGSEVTLDLNFRDGRVVDFGLVSKACALGQASSALVVNSIIGASAEELIAVAESAAALLHGEENAPLVPRFAELSILAGIKDYPQRHASTMLIFDAVLDCLRQLGCHVAENTIKLS